ncbi:MAG: NAD+-dependent secondary alcohol dehydrogenase Adh1 [Actinomycetota bacterium]|nr:NAD+-dependent secondary alcohol dehydrogenase Adh1 [Actinomycetota bacterium]
MRAARLHAYGQGLALDDVEEPTIQDPFEVIVRIGGAGLCRTDLHILEGQLEGRVEVELPYTLGHENAGWVAEVGSAVTNVGIGDPVIVHPLMSCGFCRACRAGDDMHCEESHFPGLTVDGGFAELLKTSARALVKLTPDVEPKHAAALSDAGLAAYHAVKKAALILHPGARVVVLGAGGLGHIGIQCLKVLTPAEVIVIDASPAAVELAGELGADRSLLADGTHVAAVRDLTNGGAEVVMDFVGEGSAIGDALAMLRRAGTLYAVGYGGTLHIPTIDIVSTELTVVGNLVGTYNELVELMTLAAQGRVRVHTTTYPLDAIDEAIADLRAGRLNGRGFLVP